MESSLVDIVFVGALSVLAISFSVFLFFFVPILIQVNKTIYSLRSFVELLQDFSRGIGREVVNTKNKFFGFADTAATVLVNLVKKIS